MFFLFSDHLHQVCKQIYAVSCTISCKIVMSKYNLFVSLSITHSSMIMCNRPHPDHTPVNVGHTHATEWLSENTMSLLHSSVSASEIKYYVDTLWNESFNVIAVYPLLSFSFIIHIN